MKRYYTEEAYNQIKTTINNIQENDVKGAVDFFSDVWIRIKTFLKFIKINNYEGDMQSWYGLVLDSHNSTMAEIDKIFAAVQEVDEEYQNRFNETTATINSYHATINTLRDVISGAISFSDGRSIAEQYTLVGKETLYSTATTVLEEMEERALFESCKEAIGDVISLGSSFCGLIGKFAKRDFVGAASTGKKILDSFFAIGNDAVAIASIAVIPTMGVIYKAVGVDNNKYLDFRFKELEESDSRRKLNSTTDWFKQIADNLAEDVKDCPESSPVYPFMKNLSVYMKAVAATSETVDVVADTYDVFDDVKGIVENVGETGKKIITGKTTIETRPDHYLVTNTLPEDVIPDIIKNTVKNTTGLPTSGWENWRGVLKSGSTVEKAKVIGNMFKTGKTAWGYVDSATSDDKEISDVVLKNIKPIKIVKDINDVVNDGLDTIDNGFDLIKDIARNVDPGGGDDWKIRDWMADHIYPEYPHLSGIE